jgi:hypothetical protein
MTPREFKFRVWEFPRPAEEFEGAMTYIDLREPYDAKFFAYCFRPEHKDVYAILQFTGLKDRDQREIYEGDILDYLDRRGVIRWDDSGQWGADWNDPAWNWRIAGFNSHDLIVIGNIHETPELLR